MAETGQLRLATESKLMVRRPKGEFPTDTPAGSLTPLSQPSRPHVPLSNLHL